MENILLGTIHWPPFWLPKRMQIFDPWQSRVVLSLILLSPSGLIYKIYHFTSLHCFLVKTLFESIYKLIIIKKVRRVSALVRVGNQQTRWLFILYRNRARLFCTLHKKKIWEIHGNSLNITQGFKQFPEEKKSRLHI